MSEFIVGIDLGTTNCSLAYVAREGEEESVQDYPVPQLVQAGVVEPRPTLPSYLYLPSQHEFAMGSLSLPWDEVVEHAVGSMARDEGSKVPDRLISSAKSWLCNAQVDRHQPLLPWKSPDDVAKLSPVEVSTRYLRHLAESWRFSRVGGNLGEHSVYLTVPASFDAVARELTVEAAHRAGLENLTLLEEPQAAFYEQMGDSWREAVKLGDHILVCDLGGGTSDFTLIRVDEEDGQLTLSRVAVGDHLLLGGDNMDLALAATVQARLRAEGHKIDSWQFQVLTHLCRSAKEKMLAEDPIELCPLTIPGRGSKMMGGATSTEITRAEIEKVILDGFFPLVEVTDWAQRQRRFGLTEIGLAYESEPAISRHLARFLGQSGEEGEFLRPTAVLFNGGVCKAPGIQKRVLEILNGWLDAPVQVLPNQSCDLAVARGAAAYGRARLQGGVRIRGGLPRSYYIGVEVARPAVPGFAPPTKAICVAPQGMEEGASQDLPGLELGLVLGELVEFPFMTSNQRPDDLPGQVVEDWEDEDEIEQIATVTSVLRSSESDQSVVPVQLQTVVTEVGTLELWCQQKGAEGRWKLEFEVRDKK